MKKCLCLMLSLVTLFLLVSCDFPSFIGGQEPEEPPTKIEPTRGTIEGDVYKNEYLGFEFTKPTSWVYSTDEEIAEMVDLGAEMIAGDKFEQALKNNPTVYDMMVVDSITRTNLNIGYENLSKTLSSNITIEQYIEALKSQLADVSAMKVTFPDTYETANLGQTEFTKVVCSISVQGVSMKQVYYLRKTDGYMCFVIVTIPSGYTVSQIEAMFK